MSFFDLSSPLTLPSKLLIAAAALAIYTVLVYSRGHEAGMEKYYDLKSKVAAAQKEAEADAERTRVERERIDQDTAASWAAVLDWVNANPRLVRVLPRSGCVPQAGAVPTAGREADAPAAEPRPSAIYLTADQCEFRVNNAILDAAQVMHLQNWIQQQHQASQ